MSLMKSHFQLDFSSVQRRLLGGGNPVLKIIFEIQPRIVSSGVGFCFLPGIWRHSAQTGAGINRAYVGEYFQLQIKTHLVPCSL